MPRLSFGTDSKYHEQHMFFKGYGLLIFSVSNRQLSSPLIFRFARKHCNINIFEIDKTINTVHLLVSISAYFCCLLFLSSIQLLSTLSSIYKCLSFNAHVLAQNPFPMPIYTNVMCHSHLSFSVLASLLARSGRITLEFCCMRKRNT